MTRFPSIVRSFAMLVMAAAFTTGLANGQVLSKADLKKLVATASTAQDHERIAKHYDAKAAQLEADAKDHLELAAEYRSNPTGHDQKHPMSAQTAAHCEYFAKELRRAAEEARTMAADHRAMGKPVK